jgi:hypothetical protein
MRFQDRKYKNKYRIRWLGLAKLNKKGSVGKNWKLLLKGIKN